MAKAGIVYVGTADGLATYADPGNTGRWRRVGHTLAGKTIAALIASDHLTLMVATPDGEALQSGDGGQSWSPASESDAASLAALTDALGPVIVTNHGPARWKAQHTPEPGTVTMAMLAGNQEVLLAAVAGGASLVRSENGGATWEQARVEGGLTGAVRSIAPANYHFDYAWAGTDAGQLLRSEDRGRSWRAVATEPAPIHSLAVVRIESAS
jgi:photosystem II stability/assembly factor-like uncharacterized protein